MMIFSIKQLVYMNKLLLIFTCNQTWFFSAFEIGKIRFFVVSSVFSDLLKTRFFLGPFRSFLNLETAKFCCEWFDWSNISYHPMTSFITVLTTIVSGFISTCGNVFLCSCRRDFDTKTLENGLKNVWKWEWLEKKVGEELIGWFIRKMKTRGHAYCELCNKD